MILQESMAKIFFFRNARKEGEKMSRYFLQEDLRICGSPFRAGQELEIIKEGETHVLVRLPWDEEEAEGFIIPNQKWIPRELVEILEE